MKTQISAVRDAIATLMQRADASGDIAFLKMRNTELTVQLNTAKQESLRLKNKLASSQKLINNLQTEVRRVSMRYFPKKRRKEIPGWHEDRSQVSG